MKLLNEFQEEDYVKNVILTIILSQNQNQKIQKFVINVVKN